MNPHLICSSNKKVKPALSWAFTASAAFALCGLGLLASPQAARAQVPAPWQIAHVGNGSGSAAYTNGTFTVLGSGADIYNDVDDFEYVYQPVTNEFNIVARVVSQDANNGYYAKSGVMCHNGLTSLNQEAAIYVFPTNGYDLVEFISRSSDGSTTSVGSGAGRITEGAIYVRLTRVGNEFTGYQSADGVNWSQVGAATIAMPANVLAGLHQEPNDSSVQGGATFDQVVLNGTLTGPPSTPSFTPTGGTYVGAQSVTISADAGVSGETIFYTTDGTNPTNSGTVQSGASPVIVSVAVGATETIMAYATNSGVGSSAVVSATYTTVSGTTGVWTNLAGGNYSVSGNWTNNAVPNGGGVTADFSSLTLTANTTVSLDFPVTLGSLLFGDAGIAYSWTVDGGNTLTLAGNGGASTITVNNQTNTMAVVMAGTNNLTKTGSGTLTLSAANTYTGNTIVNGGTLMFSGGGTIPSGNTLTINNGGTLTFGQNDTWGGDGTTTSAAITVNTGGTLASGGDFNTLWNVTLNDGMVLLNGGAYDAYPAFQFGGTLTASGISAVNVGSGVYNLINIGGAGNGNLTVSTPNVTDVFTVNGPLQDNNQISPSGLIKTGSGTLTLAGANTYTGTTTVSNGMLQVNAGSALATGPIIVYGGTFEMDGFNASGAPTASAALTINGGLVDGNNGQLYGPVTVNGGVLSAGTTASMGTLYIYNTLSISSGGTVAMRIDKTGGSLSYDSLSSGGYSVTYDGTLTVTNVTSDATPLAANDAFYLFPGAGSGNYHGTFAIVNLPALPDGLSWDLSGLTSDGSIKVTTGTPTPVFAPPAGNYAGSLSVNISSEPGAEIYYTTDGSDPTTSSTVQSNASPAVVVIPADTANYVINAYAISPGKGPGPASGYAFATYNTVTTPTWLAPYSDNWSDIYSWSNNVVANGVGVTADFSKLTLSDSDTTVTLDAPETVGSLVFADQGNAYNWVLTNSFSGVLTLAVTNGSPTIAVTNQSATLAVPLAGTNGLTKTGAGTLTLSANNTYTGNIVISNGALLANSDNIWDTLATAGALGNPSIAGRTVTINDGGVLQFGSGNLLGGPQTNEYPQLAFVINHGGSMIGYSGDLNTIGALTLNGGTLTTADGYGSGAQSFYLSSGSVTVGGSSASLIQAGGTTNNGIHLAATTTFNVASTGATGADLTVSAALLNRDQDDSGTASLVKTGAGTMALNAVNTYSGTTMVNAGTLQVNGSLNIGAVTVSGGTLGGNGTIGGAVTVNSGGTLAAGTASLDALTINHSLNLNGNVRFNISKTGGTLAWNQMLGTTTVTYGGTLMVTNLTSDTNQLAAGDSFQLFPSGTYFGGFRSTNLPALSAGLAWDTTGLTNNGSIQVVSEVVVTPPTLSGGKALGGGQFEMTFSGTSNQTYSVLTATNLTLPLANWTVLTSGKFGGASVIYTNTTATNKTQFYRIKSP